MSLRPWPQSLAGQLVLLLLGALVLAQIATAVIFAESRRSALREAGREQVLARAAALVRLLEETPADLHGRILRAAEGGSTRFSLDEGPQVGAGDAADGPLAAALLRDAFGAREVRAAMIGRPRMLHMHDRGRDDDDEDDGRALRARAPVIALAVRLEGGRWLNAETALPDPARFAWPALVSTLLIGAALVVVVVLSVRRITRPLRKLATAADRFGRGESVPDLKPEGPEEVRRTIAAFDAMQARVGRFVADRTRMIAAISHDLRTPLTSLRLRAEFVEDEDLRERIVDTVDEMSRMTEAALAFARDEADGERARPTDLSALVRAVADDFADLGADVTVTGPERIEHVVRPVALRRALRNLVENAVRYGERARIALSEGPGEVVVAIDDDGPGIPPERMEDVFEPFVRLETSRSAETGGVGLGLSTARSIARAHGGDLTLANRPGGGLTATLRLPRGA